MTNDLIYRLARDILRIDNRKDGDIAKETGLSTQTIKRIRSGERSYIFSRTASEVARKLGYSISHKRSR